MLARGAVAPVVSAAASLTGSIPLLLRDRVGIRAALVLGVAAALVLVRALVYLLFEQVGFVSD
jgi:hypothetical protein